MNSYLKNERLYIALEGRIDSSNAAQIEQEIEKILALHPGLPLTLDAEDLFYISSAGLRVLMKLKKGGQKDLTIQNVSPEVYEVFELTGMSALMNVQKRMRQIEVRDCPVIGQGTFGTVYRLDSDTVVKVYRGGERSLPIIREETAKARQALICGVPTALPFDIVQVDDQYGSVFELIDAQNLNDLVADNPAELDTVLPLYTAFLKKLHGIEMEQTLFPSARDIYLENLSEYASFLDEDTLALLTGLLKRMPDDLHLLHGDIQMKNVMLASGEVILIDMDKICTGNPAFEFASLFATYVAFNEDDPDNSMKFVGIRREDAFRIYHDSLLAYLNSPDEETFERMEKKVRLLGYMRFMAILTLELKDADSPLKELQIRHAAENLKNLSSQVDSLMI